MKKTIIAVATAAVFATSANAATVFEKDGTKVNVNGGVGVVFVKDKTMRTDLRNDDSNIAFEVSHKINDSLTALGYAKLAFEGEGNSTFGNPKLDTLYAGFDVNGVGTLTFGKQATNGDEVVLNNHAYFFSATNTLTTAEEKLVKFRSADFHGLSVGLDYTFGKANAKEEGDGLKHAYQTSLFYNRELNNGLKFGFASGYETRSYAEPESMQTFFQERRYRVSGQVAYGPITFGVEYGIEKQSYKSPDQKFYTEKRLLVSTAYQVLDTSKVYAQYEKVKARTHVPDYQEIDATSGYELLDPYANIDVFTLGADYKFNKNVVTYVEYQRSVEKAGLKRVYHTTTNEGDVTNERSRLTDNRVAVGLRVLF